jgi:hypothetical protein
MLSRRRGHYFETSSTNYPVRCVQCGTTITWADEDRLDDAHGDLCPEVGT